MKTLLCCVGATLVRSIRHPLFIMLGTLLFVGSAATQPRPETYHEYVARSTVVASDYAALAAALRESQDPLITMEDLEPLVASNMAFIDGSTAGRSGVVTPSSAAHIAVPLLVQAVRDWTEAGAAQRATTYAPLVEALQPTLLDVPSPRILVPGSGLGRLLFELAEHLPGSEVVGVDPDVHAMLLAAHLIAGGSGESAAVPASACTDDKIASSSRLPASADAAHEGQRACGTDAAADAGGGAATVYPSIHIQTNWARAADRLSGVRIPDVTLATLRQVQQRSNVTLVVGSFPAAMESGKLDGETRDAYAADVDAAGGSHERGHHRRPPRAFDAVATCYALDVFDDTLAAMRALHALLLPTGGLWANLGPLAYPEEPTPAAGASAAPPTRRIALTASQMLALVAHAGFEVEQHQLMDGCTYTRLPHQLEQTVRTCLFFTARPRASSS